MRNGRKNELKVSSNHLQHLSLSSATVIIVFVVNIVDPVLDRMKYEVIHFIAILS